MRVGIICGATDGGKSGISVYTQKVLEAMVSENSSNDLVLFRFEEDTFLTENIPHPIETVFIHSAFQKPVLSIVWHIFILPFLSLYYSIDRVFLPAGNRRLTLWSPVPVIATVHDLSQLHIEGKYDGFRMFYVTRVLPFLMTQLDHIIAISQSTANDIMEYCHIPQSRITVVYNGIDHAKFSSAKDDSTSRARLKERYGIDGSYVLYVSRIEHPGKNHTGLLNAWKDFIQDPRYSSTKLVLCGAPWPGSEPVFTLCEDLGLSDSVIFTGFADKPDLPLLYTCATCFVLPSFFEGFGLPLLEAMAAHTPVLCSNSSSLPEVAGDGAILFDPEHPSQITDALKKIFGDKLARDFLVDKGSAQVKTFTWENTASQSLELITLELEGMKKWRSGTVNP